MRDIRISPTSEIIPAICARSNRFSRRRDYRGQIDYFAVYSPDLKKAYLVPVDHVSSVEGYLLRIEPTKNGQEKNIRWAQDYEL
jgi:hypothetical protein